MGDLHTRRSTGSGSLMPKSQRTRPVPGWLRGETLHWRISCSTIGVLRSELIAQGDAMHKRFLSLSMITRRGLRKLAWPITILLLVPLASTARLVTPIPALAVAE